MTRSEILEGVKAVLEQSLGAAPENITPQASLADDLGADSLDVIEIVVRLNKRFSLKLSAKELSEQLNDGRLGAMATRDGAAPAVETESQGNGSIAERVSRLDTRRKTAELVTVDFLVDIVENYLRVGAQQVA